MIGRTLYPVTKWCDNESARKCTEMNGSHKLKIFEESIKDIQKEMESIEVIGNRKHMADSHGHFVK